MKDKELRGEVRRLEKDLLEAERVEDDALELRLNLFKNSDLDITMRLQETNDRLSVLFSKIKELKDELQTIKLCQHIPTVLSKIYKKLEAIDDKLPKKKNK